MNRFMSDHDLDRPAQLVAAPLVPVQRLVPHNNNQPQQQQQVLEHLNPTPLPAATEPNAEPDTQLEEGDIIGRPGQPSQRYRLLKLMGRIGQAGAVPLLPHPAVSTTSSSMELNVPPLPRAAAPPPPSHPDQCSDVPVQIDGEPRPEPGAAGDPHAEFVHPKWRLQSKVDSGGHGEVWWAVHEGAYDDDDDDDDLANNTTTNTVYSHYVLKRVFVDRGEELILAGLREAHFGFKLRHALHVARFVESFNRTVGTRREMWLVFVDEGINLHRFLYSKRSIQSGGYIYEPSDFWRKMRTDRAGTAVMRDMLRQILAGLAELHGANVTHRDIKPPNLLVNMDAAAVVKFADFGSAVDDYTRQHLYGPAGPGTAQETHHYQPPEILFADDADAVPRTTAYDVWSVGVVALELLLGRSDVFSLAPRAQALLYHRLRDKSEAVRAKAAILTSMAELCVYSPEHDTPRVDSEEVEDHVASPPSSCGLAQFNGTLRRRDSFGKGFEDHWGLRLLWRLLQWNPERRISAAAAQHHAYFKGPHTCPMCGTQFELPAELHAHQASHRHNLLPVAAASSASSTAADSSASVVAVEPPRRFHCAHCGRVFTSWASCHQHVASRRGRHGRFCAYSTVDLPPCTHAVHPHDADPGMSMTVAVYRNDATAGDPSVLRSVIPPLPVTPTAPHTAWCGLISRRPYMEDYNTETTIAVPAGLVDPAQRGSGTYVKAQYYAVFDGHLGVHAASYASRHLHRAIERALAAAGAGPAPNASMPEGDAATRFRGPLVSAFHSVDEGFRTRFAGDQSGSTATVALLMPPVARTRHRLVVLASVGDSRGVLVRVPQQEQGNDAPAVIMATKDHTPADPAERERIEAAGGFIEFRGVLRVQGNLAVTRSLGDLELRQFLLATPGVYAAEVPYHVASAHGAPSHLLVLASDGFWDVVSRDEVALLLASYAGPPPERAINVHAAATQLAREAYVRGSPDNIGVYVLDVSRS